MSLKYRAIYILDCLTPAGVDWGATLRSAGVPTGVDRRQHDSPSLAVDLDLNN